MAFRVFFAIASFYNLEIDQIDVETVFLYGLINHRVYVEISKEIELESDRNMVCKLFKALYSLKKSPRLWYKVLSTSFLKKLGLKRMNVDQSIFVMETGMNQPIVSIFCR